MAVSVTVKNLPEHTIERLKARATQNHRSLQGEITAILEDAAGPRALTVDEVFERAKASGLKTESSADLIRQRGHAPLDEPLLREAERTAAQRGTTLTALIQEALRAELARRPLTRHREKIELPVSRGRLLPGVDLDDAAALLDLMEQSG